MRSGTSGRRCGSDAQQKARNVRELDATREVARLDLKLAQETVQMMQAKFDQGRATLRRSSRLGWMKATNGWLFWTRILRGSRDN